LSVLENTPLLPRLEQHLRRTAKGSGKTNPP
jgi:hypothetical protein